MLNYFIYIKLQIMETLGIDYTQIGKGLKWETGKPEIDYTQKGKDFKHETEKPKDPTQKQTVRQLLEQINKNYIVGPEDNGALDELTRQFTDEANGISKETIKVTTDLFRQSLEKWFTVKNIEGYNTLRKMLTLIFPDINVSLPDYSILSKDYWDFSVKYENNELNVFDDISLKWKISFIYWDFKKTGFEPLTGELEWDNNEIDLKKVIGKVGKESDHMIVESANNALKDAELSLRSSKKWSIKEAQSLYDSSLIQLSNAKELIDSDRRIDSSILDTLKIAEDKINEAKKAIDNIGPSVEGKSKVSYEWNNKWINAFVENIDAPTKTELKKIFDENINYKWNLKNNPALTYAIQVQLWNMYTGKIDGIFKEKTMIALKNYQKAYGITHDKNSLTNTINYMTTDLSKKTL